jgi:hypothetical protein
MTYGSHESPPSRGECCRPAAVAHRSTFPLRKGESKCGSKKGSECFALRHQRLATHESECGSECNESKCGSEKESECGSECELSMGQTRTSGKKKNAKFALRLVSHPCSPTYFPTHLPPPLTPILTPPYAYFPIHLLPFLLLPTLTPILTSAAKRLPFQQGRLVQITNYKITNYSLSALAPSP